MTSIFILDGSFHSIILPKYYELFSQLDGNIGYYDVNTDRGKVLAECGIDYDNLPALLVWDSQNQLVLKVENVYTELNLDYLYNLMVKHN